MAAFGSPIYVNILLVCNIALFGFEMYQLYIENISEYMVRGNIIDLTGGICMIFYCYLHP